MTDALSYKAINTLQNSLRKIFGRVKAAHLNAIALTHDDVLALFAPADHRPLLRQARKIAYGYGRSDMSMDVSNFPGDHHALLYVTVYDRPGRKAPLLPRHPQSQPDTPPELAQKLQAWMARRVQIGTDFALAQHVLNRLNKECKSAAHVRYLWPSIVQIARVNEATVPLADKLAIYRTVSDPPVLSTAMRDAVRRTAAAIVTASFLPNKIEDVPREVTINMANFHPVNAPEFGAFTPW